MKTRAGTKIPRDRSNQLEQTHLHPWATVFRVLSRCKKLWRKMREPLQQLPAVKRAGRISWDRSSNIKSDSNLRWPLPHRLWLQHYNLLICTKTSRAEGSLMLTYRQDSREAQGKALFKTVDSDSGHLGALLPPREVRRATNTYRNL